MHLRDHTVKGQRLPLEGVLTGAHPAGPPPTAGQGVRGVACSRRTPCSPAVTSARQVGTGPGDGTHANDRLREVLDAGPPHCTPSLSDLGCFSLNGFPRSLRHLDKEVSF